MGAQFPQAMTGYKVYITWQLIFIYFWQIEVNKPVRAVILLGDQHNIEPPDAAVPGYLSNPTTQAASPCWLESRVNGAKVVTMQYGTAPLAKCS